MKNVLYYCTALLMLCIMSLAVLPGSADTINAVSYWPQASSLYQGQTSSYLISVDCGAQVTLISPDNGNYYLYAMKSRGFTPTDSYVMNNADLVANGYTQTKSLSLDQGQWYLVVYAQSGYGQYQLTKQDTCSRPDPCQGNPNCGGGTNCQPKYTNTQSGVLLPGQSNVYGYSIGGRRSAIEWILKSSNCNYDVPIAMMSTDQVSSFRKVSCGSNIELYIYKDCPPGSCNAMAADTTSGSNAYVRVSNPTTGSIYYAQVYVRNGSGKVSYQLTCRSYDCNNIIPMSVGTGTETPIQMMSTAEDVPSPDPHPPAPINVGN